MYIIYNNPCKSACTYEKHFKDILCSACLMCITYIRNTYIQSIRDEKIYIYRRSPYISLTPFDPSTFYTLFLVTTIKTVEGLIEEVHINHVSTF